MASEHDRHDPAPALTIGKLFPADDPVARWVFSLSAAVEDLARAERRFIETLDSPVDSFSLVSTASQYRQLVARIYEAERPVRSVETPTDVRTFLEGIPAAKEPLDRLRHFYSPWSASEASPVRQLFGATRHLAVHHAWPDSDELRDTLTAARELEARILVDPNEEYLSYEWVELVAIHAMIGASNLDDRETDMRAKVAVAQAILGWFSALLNAVLPVHCRRLGIEPVQLLREPPTRSASNESDLDRPASQP